MADPTPDVAHVRLCPPFDLAGYALTGPADDVAVIGHIRRSGGTYEPGVMQALRRLLAPDAVAVDIGANIGVFALVMSRIARRGTVYAFEPVPENLDHLRANLAANGATNVVVEALAVSDEPGVVPFVYSESGSFIATPGSPGTRPPATHPVEAVRLDDYVASAGIDRVDLVMVDAEGADLAVLRGARTTLAVHRPALLVEVNPVSLRRAGASFRELVAIARRGRTLYVIGEDGGLSAVASDHHIELLLHAEGVIDLLCLPRTRRPSPAVELAARARGLAGYARLRRALRAAAPPETNFVVEPALEMTSSCRKAAGGPGERHDIDVTVTNRGDTWLSSDFPYHPVHVSYRWFLNGSRLENLDSHRGRFAQPLAPGRSGIVPVPIQLPPVPGDYVLAFTVVQENFAWFDDLDPDLRLLVPVAVRER